MSEQSPTHRSRRLPAVAAAVLVAGGSGYAIGNRVVTHNNKEHDLSTEIQEVRGGKEDALKRFLSPQKIESLRKVLSLNREEITQMNGDQLFAEGADIQGAALDLSDATGVDADQVKDMMLSRGASAALSERHITFKPAAPNECLNGSGHLAPDGELVSANFPLSNEE